jgi:hypothetical protein
MTHTILFLTICLLVDCFCFVSVFVVVAAGCWLLLVVADVAIFTVLIAAANIISHHCFCSSSQFFLCLFLFCIKLPGLHTIKIVCPVLESFYSILQKNDPNNSFYTISA